MPADKRIAHQTRSEQQLNRTRTAFLNAWFVYLKNDQPVFDDAVADAHAVAVAMLALLEFPTPAK